MQFGSIPLSLTIETSGDGLWSRRATAVKLTQLDWERSAGDEEAGIEPEVLAQVFFDPSTWNVETDGLIYTDKSFIKLLKVSLSQLEREGQLPAFGWHAVNYTEQGMQGADYVHVIVGEW